MRSTLLALSVALGAALPASAAPERIVSVGGAVTEILYALEEESRIVAVDTTSTYPPEALAEKPNVGYLRGLSAEGVLALSPDLIVMEEGAGPPEAVALIDSAGVAVSRVPTGWTVSELLEKVRLVAAAVDQTAAGEAMASQIESELGVLAEDLAAVGEKRRILFILSVADGRARAAGSGTGADAVIGLAGAENVFGDVEGYQTLSPEAAAALAPDVILMVSRGGPSSVDPLSIPALAATPAGRTGTVITMDAEYLLGFGPRMPAALRELSARLYPQVAIDDDGVR